MVFLFTFGKLSQHSEIYEGKKKEKINENKTKQNKAKQKGAINK